MNNIKTNIVGTILIVGAIVSVLAKITTWLDAATVITLGTGFLFAKDHDNV